MKFLFSLFFISAIFSSAFAQKSPINDFAVRKGNFRHFTKEVSAEDFFQKFHKDLGLGEKNEMRLVAKIEDEIGFEHLKYVQTYKGVPIEGAEYILHTKNGLVQKTNGKIEENFALNLSPVIASDAALNIALQNVKATVYSWQNAGAENALKQAKNDEKASYFPQLNLIFSKAGGEKYRLVYKTEINAVTPLIRKDVYIDAVTGNILLIINKLHFADTEGTAATKYSGTQKITTNKVSESLFQLKETGRCGIETYNLKKGTNYDKAVIFTDTDNVWENINADKDEIATDVHWGTEKTYDYYLEKHNRKSFDNKNSKLLSYVHYDKNFANAFWNGAVMTYGDGDTVRLAPLVSIDIIAHEITHGVTENSAALIYLNESGALNESFSDIFGVAVDFFTGRNKANFEIGEEIDLKNSGGFRSMSNPKAKKNPATYKGDFWEFTAFDNGGVHINSGVQNHWFYLLCEGGKGKNDNGNEFGVSAIGMEKAAKIAYRNLTVYLTSTSVYADAREGSLQAAADLFGECSPEYFAVANAWFAVGVGFPLKNNDFALESLEETVKTSCGLSASESIKIKLRFNSCQGKLPAGTKIPVSYRINDFPTVLETLTTSKEISPSEVFFYTFNKKADLSAPATYDISAEVAFPNDPESRNNFSEVLQIKKPHPVKDMYFEDPIGGTEDSLYFLKGREAKLEISEKAKKSSDLGMLFTGGMPSTSLDFPDGTNNFDINEDYRSEVCLCIDASKSEDKITLNYDYKMNYTSLYELMAALIPELAGLDFKNSSSFRVKVNGKQQGAFMRPASYTKDNFKTMSVDLSAYKGQKFELCFEARCFSSEKGIQDLLKQLGLPIPVQGADEVYLDNIRFKGLFKNDTEPTAIVNEELERAINIFPNPASFKTFLTYESTQSEKISISVQDLIGKILFKAEKDVNFGENKFELALSQKGMFLVRIETSKGTSVRKLLIE